MNWPNLNFNLSDVLAGLKSSGIVWSVGLMALIAIVTLLIVARIACYFNYRACLHFVFEYTGANLYTDPSFRDNCAVNILYLDADATEAGVLQCCSIGYFKRLLDQPQSSYPPLVLVDASTVIPTQGKLYNRCFVVWPHRINRWNPEVEIRSDSECYYASLCGLNDNYFKIITHKDDGYDYFLSSLISELTATELETFAHV